MSTYEFVTPHDYQMNHNSTVLILLKSSISTIYNRCAGLIVAL